MQQAFYTSMSNANLVEGKPGKKYTSGPTPLIKEKFLGEFRSELEKAKARENLGIADDYSLKWKNILGSVEESPTLLSYIKSVWNYTNSLYPNVTDVKGALDEMLSFINQFSSEEEQIKKIQEDLTSLKSSLDEVTEESATTVEWAEGVKSKLEEIAKSLSDINSLITISDTVGNALTNNSGLYVPDLSLRVADLEDAVETYNTTLDETYTSPYTIGGISKGTSVKDLKDMSITSLLDLMLFPTVTRSLVLPTYKAVESSRLVKIGDTPKPLEFIFTQNDAGEKISETLDLELPETYVGPNTITYTSTVNYEAGEYLVDNKGVITNIRIEAGSKTASTAITTTYPWYINDMELVLVPYNTTTEVEISLIGSPTIKLPGLNTTISAFKADGGLGYLDVNMTSWELGTEEINGITYKTWTKTDSYPAYISHKLKFTLRS